MPFIHSFILQTCLGLQLWVQPLHWGPKFRVSGDPGLGACKQPESTQIPEGTGVAPLPLPALPAAYASHRIANLIQAHSCLLADPPGRCAGYDTEASSQGPLYPQTSARSLRRCLKDIAAL